MCGSRGMTPRFEDGGAILFRRISSPMSKSVQSSKPSAAAKVGSKVVKKVAKTPSPDFHEFKCEGIEIAVGVLIEHNHNNSLNRDCWSLEFRVKQPFSRTSFLVSEPDIISRKQWARVARGEEGVTLYQGEGDGAIDIRNKEFHFVASLSGSSGGIDFTDAIPTHMVCPLLMAALADADRLGLAFYVDPHHQTDDETEDESEDDADENADDVEADASKETPAGSEKIENAEAEDDVVALHS